MPDMLVKLFELPDAGPLLRDLSGRGIEIRRAVSPEKHIVLDWVGETFSRGWANECEVTFSNHPASCFIAIEEGKPIGFACHDAFAFKNYFGPTGVSDERRGLGVGKALLLTCLQSMAAQGYAYGIIAWVGPVEFYAKTVGAIVIEGSTPPIYQRLLQE